MSCWYARASRHRDELLGGDDALDEPVAADQPDAVERLEDVVRPTPTLPPEALQVLDQRALAAIELVLVDVLDAPDQSAQRLHERERTGVQGLDRTEHLLEMGAQHGAVWLGRREQVRELVQGAEDLGQPCGVEPPVLLAKLV